MTERFTTRLAPGQALALAATREPRRIVVTQGRLWLTDGGPEDHWLRVGEGLTLAAGRRAVVEGWPEAEFHLLLPEARRARARPARGWRMSLNLAGQGA